MRYKHKSIEKRWQKKWEKAGVFHASTSTDKSKFYALIESPYPSGQGLRVEHPRSYTALDIVSHRRRMVGYNVLYPIGWDAFGLPTENFAIENRVYPAIVTKKNTARFRQQLQAPGLSFGWSREVSTTDPSYYRWTQWVFLQTFERELTYKKEMSINWCTSCRCILTSEEVVNGVYERCGGEVVHKVKSQWVLKATEYAQHLMDNLDLVDCPEHVKAQQRNWIGRSTGTEVRFQTSRGEELAIYTTRLSTLYGAAYMVLSPEHPYLETWVDSLHSLDEIHTYQQEASRKSDFERTEVAKKKTGVHLDGVTATNPLTGKEIPIFILDYVLVSYGTDAIMAVPGHDTYDWGFTRKPNLSIIEVIQGGSVEKKAFTDCETGVIVSSGILGDLTVEEAKKEIIECLAEQGTGEQKVNFKLRDWVFSRQRHWGEPIPIVHCDKCGLVGLPESELPLTLPEVKSYEPADSGESPLAHMTNWVNATYPHCDVPAKREADAMPQWADSSWYFLRYMDSHNDKTLAGKETLEYWSPVDWYNGGVEHTTLHLLYNHSRHRFLYDIDVVPTPEPYAKRTSHGMVLGENGGKMSKSRGNVADPDEIVEEYGADTMRPYEMFVDDFEKVTPWNTASIKGSRRFLERYYTLTERLVPGDQITPTLKQLFHKTVKKVGEDIENLKFNTATASLMAPINDISNVGPIDRRGLRVFTLLLDPFAPHVTGEVRTQAKLGTGLVAGRSWPKCGEERCRESMVEIALQVSGKVYARIEIPMEYTKERAIQTVKDQPKIAAELSSKQVVKKIYVPGRLVNVVAK